MLTLRKILLFKPLYFGIFILSILYILLSLNYESKSLYQGSETEISGIVETISINNDDNSLKMTIKAKEKILTTYYFKSQTELDQLKNNIHLGDYLKINGQLKLPHSTQNFYSFSYTTYLQRKGIFYLMQGDSITKISSNTNIIWKLKDMLYTHISKLGDVSCYIKTFFLGNQDDVSDTLKSSFQKIGISHLFALSGTQISFLTALILKLLSLFKLSTIKKYLILFIILVFYYLLIDSCAAIERALVFTFIFSINKVFNFFIPSFYLILLSMSVLFFLNPNYIFDIGFLYSSIISIGLILYSTRQDKKISFVKELFVISWLSFLLSLPISLYNFSYINILSILYNIFYVPFINFIVFPLAMLSVIIPFVSPLLLFFTTILEKTVYFLDNISVGIMIFPRVSLLFYVLYYVFIIPYILNMKKKFCFFLLTLFLFIHYMKPYIWQENAIYVLDVGQGDSFLILSNGKSMLIDTGGKMNYYDEKNKDQEESGIGTYSVQFFYYLGIKKLDYLVLTHGDVDHAKEALTILDKMKVEKVYLNDGPINELEKEIIKKGKQVGSHIKEVKQNDIIRVGDFIFQSLNKAYEDENESSIVLYGMYNQYNFLFMGDAPTSVEKTILEEYELGEIDFLKIGHHGSKTSSSDEFLDVIKPKIGIISAGIDNKFNHPNEEVVKRYYEHQTLLLQTHVDGMIKIDFNKKQIKTYQNRFYQLAK